MALLMGLLLGFAVVPFYPAFSPNAIFYNTRNTTQGSVLQKNVVSSLNFLIKQTPLNGSADYKIGNGSDIVWSHGECYYNFSKESCSTCLKSISYNFEQVIPLAVGARFWINTTSQSCDVRYENYEFGTQAPPPPPLAPPPPVAPPPPASPILASPALAPVSPGASLTSGSGSKKKIFVGVSVGGAALLAALLGGIFLLYSTKRIRHQLNERHRLPLNAELERSYEGPLAFTLEELKAATKNFSDENKLGEGGFGAVYKAIMKDGTQVAVKRLSVESQQGGQEFGNEIHIISNIQHRNLVRLKGYCVQGDQKLLVYEFLENGSLDRALFSADPGRNLDWPARFNIVIGVARGLAYLHEESHIVIIHRDIKASNILLDRKLNPKISDFGISKLFDMEKGYTSTRVAGTQGYLAPEYVLRGKLTAKADVYSFGILLLEIISGRKCCDPKLSSDEMLLLQWTWSLKQSGRLHEVVDRRLRSSGDLEAEVLRVVQVALVCTHDDEELRPVMSNVVTMLLGHVEIPPTQAQAPDYLPKIEPLHLLQSLSSASSSQESITKLDAR